MSLAARTKYSGLSMAFHWLIFVLVIANWRISEAAEHAPSREAGSEIMGYHFALGVLIFVVAALRLVWRQVSPPPPSNPAHAGWERALARVIHMVFYALLLGMPLAGWVAMSSFGEPIDVFGLFSLPPLPVGMSEARGEAIFELHGTAGIALLVLIVLHALGSLKHTLVDKDGNLFRMLPFGKAKG